MTINGHTKTLGVIGCPIAHTLSPLIHNLLAQILDHNLVYVPFLVEKDLESAIKGARALQISGLNITIPYKTEVLKYVAEVDDFAQKIGAVNTLVPIENGFKAYNTDIPGLYRAMLSDGVVLKDESVIILGAGGAARSVAMLCMEKGADKVYILNRTLSKAQAIADEVNVLKGSELVVPIEIMDYKKLAGRKYLCIQATSVGMHPDVDSAVIEATEFYDLVHTGYDIVYNPCETKFMSLVKAHGGQAFNGLKMLLYQGIIAYELWNDVEISDDVADFVLSKLKEELNL